MSYSDSTSKVAYFYTMLFSKFWLWKKSARPTRETSYHLGRFRCTCWCNFGKISGFPPLALNLTMKVKYRVKGYARVSHSGMLPTVRDHFRTCADLISGQYPVLRSLTLNLTLKVKCQVKGFCCASCPGKLAVSWDYFGMQADVIWGRFPVLCPLTLHLTVKITFKIKM